MSERNRISRFLSLTVVALATLVFGTSSAHAANLYWSGTGTWGTASAWGATSGGPYSGSTWTNGDSAFFEDPKGTITLDSSFSLDLLDITSSASAADGTDYIIGNTPGNNTLTFTGTKTLTTTGTDVTINSGIAGSPALDMTTRANNAATMTLNPGSLTQVYASTNVVKGSNARLILQGTSTGNSTGVITTSAGATQVFLDKDGAGTWTIDGFSGGDSRIDVIAGTLIANGTVTPTHLFQVRSGATLSGTASIGPFDHTSSLNVLAGGAVAPGTSIGTLTINDEALTWNSDDATAGMVFELSTSDNSSDLLDITGTGDFLKGTGTSFLFEMIGGKFGETYTLVNFDTTTFSESDFGVTSGFEGTFTLTASSLLYTTIDAPVPEPSTFVLAALGMLGLTRTRRRRRC